jgi:hypothetical protein
VRGGRWSGAEDSTKKNRKNPLQKIYVVIKYLNGKQWGDKVGVEVGVTHPPPSTPCISWLQFKCLMTTLKLISFFWFLCALTDPPVTSQAVSQNTKQAQISFKCNEIQGKFWIYWEHILQKKSTFTLYFEMFFLWRHMKHKRF